MKALAPVGGALCVLLCSAASGAWGAEPVVGEPIGTMRQLGPIVEQPGLFSADDLFLLEVDADGYQLSDSLGAFSSRSGLFVPLGELSRLLDIAVTVDSGRGVAEGSVLSASRTFRLNLRAGTATIGDRQVTFTAADAAAYDGDIYVRAELLEQLLPLKLKPQLHDLILVVAPTERLPFQDRAARENARDRLGRGGAEEVVMRVHTPYTAFTAPGVDLNLSLGAGTRSPKTAARYDLRAAGDLAYASAQFFAGSDDSGRLNDVRLMLERKDPDGRDAGLRGLTRVSVGDTFTPYLPLGPGSASGRGVFITTAPLEQTSVFDATDIRGELPQGWDAELYLNEVLQGSQQEPIDGRYEFRGVRLAYGLNIIRIVLYGPRGERREELRRINVGAGLLGKGEASVTLGAVQQSTPLIDLHRPSFVDPAVVGSPLTGSVIPGKGDWRLAAQLAYGVSAMTTVSASAARYSIVTGEARNLVEASVASSFAGLAGQLSAAKDNEGGSAVSLGLAGRPLGASTVLRHTEYAGGFIDEVQAQGIGLRRSTNLSMDVAPRLRGIGILPMSFRGTWDSFIGGGSLVGAGLQVSKPIGRYLASSSLDYQSVRDSLGLSTHQLRGLLELTALVRSSWQLRGGAAYTASPRQRLDSVFLTADRNLGDRTAVRLSLSQSFGHAASTTIAAANTWRLKKADISFTAGYDTYYKDLRIGFNVSTSFGYDPMRRRYGLVGAGAANGGEMEVQAFVDANGDGRRDAGEEGVPNILVQGGRRPALTDADGVAMITGLGDGARARARLDLERVDDPYLVGPPPVVEIVPRPGRVAVVPYPMVSTSEVEIKAVFQRPDEPSRGLSALALQLIDGAGAVAAEGRTEYDGTLLLEGIKPGAYAVQIEPAQAARLKLALKDPVRIVVKAVGGFAGQTTATIVKSPDAP